MGFVRWFLVISIAVCGLVFALGLLPRQAAMTLGLVLSALNAGMQTSVIALRYERRLITSQLSLLFVLAVMMAVCAAKILNPNFFPHP
jgi:hypothetical protein